MQVEPRLFISYYDVLHIFSLFPCPKIVSFWPAGFGSSQVDSSFTGTNFGKILGFLGGKESAGLNKQGFSEKVS